MSGPYLAAIKTQSILSSNDENQHGGTITTYAGVVNLLLEGYETGAVIANAPKDIQNLKKGAFTP